jgi:hypothetical protein
MIEKILEAKDFIANQYNNILKAKSRAGQRMYSFGIILKLQEILPESKDYDPNSISDFAYKFASTSDDEAIEMILQKEYQPCMDT